MRLTACSQMNRPRNVLVSQRLEPSFVIGHILAVVGRLGASAFMLLRPTVVLMVILGVSIAIIACGSPSGPSQSGNLRVMITDSPYGDASAVHVTFRELQVHPAYGGDWLPVDFAGAAASRTCNLKKLEGPIDILGADSLTAGPYGQVRMVVAEAVIYFGGTATAEPACAAALAPPTGFTSRAPLEIPSGEVKLNRQFELVGNGTTTIDLDFEGDKSITRTGNNRYRMTPVIAIKSVSMP